MGVIFQIDRGTRVYSDLHCRKHSGNLPCKLKVENPSQIKDVAFNGYTLKLISLKLGEGWVRVEDIELKVSIAEMQQRLSNINVLSGQRISFPRHWK